MVVGKGFPGLKAPGIWGVAGKLWLAFGLLVLVLAVSGLVSYRSIQQIDRDLRRFVAVEEPLERAALEMEINAGEGARAVLDYVRELAPEHIEARRDSEADFERFSRDFERLAETDDERRLGREVAGLHGVFKALGDEIVGLSDLRRNALETFRRDVLEIDELIDGKLQKALDTTAHEGMMKLHSTLDMEINIFKAFAAIEGYAARPDPTLRLELEDAEADFERYETIYRETSLSTKEKGWLDQIDRNFAEAVMAGERIMTVTDGLNTRLEEFEQHLAKIDAILDNQIQPLIHAETVAAAADAKTSTDLAALYLILLGLMGLCVAIAAAWVISRAIIGPIRALVSGAEIVGGGDLAHRIEAASRDEFGHLARAFNAMVENLARALRRIEDAREQLEGRVAERTRDLTSELAARARAEEALREARDSLERRVRERTAELRKTNAELEKEVTERKRIETEQRRMAAVVRDSHDAITMQDFSGQIIAWNRGAEAMYSYSEAEALKMNARDLMPEDKRAEAEEIALATTRGEDVSVFRTQRRAKDGRLLEVSLTVTLLVGEHGKPVGLATTERDITERKRAEDALLASEERLAEILDIAPEGVITVDGNGRIELFNKGAEAIFGHSAQEMIGQTLDRLIPTRFRDIHHKHLEEFKTMSRGQHVMGLGKEILGLRKDGTEFPAEAVISKLESGGQTTFMVMMYDITERKRVEQQLTQSQKMEAIGQLTGGIAHDFNNLLMIIDGYARRTLSNIGDVEIAGRSLEEVLAATEKAANLTKQLLGFSRRQIMDKQVFPVAESVSELKRLLEQSVGEQHELEFEISDKKVCVHTDPGELSQAILNLAINARDAMPEGGKITIGVRVIGGDAEFIESDENTPEESFVEISVTDKGCGIDENTMEHIFEPFFTTKEQGQGTGLGLLMAYGFARQSGGKLEVISSVGKGTTVYIYLPVAKRSPTLKSIQEQIEHRGNGETILLVEDDNRLLELIYDWLYDLGYKVVVADNGFEALTVDEAMEKPVDLLLSDVVMPSLGGFELYEILKERRSDMKAVFMSGYPKRGAGKIEIQENTPFLQNRSNRVSLPTRSEWNSIGLALRYTASPGSVRTMKFLDEPLEDLRIFLVEDNREAMNLIKNMLKDFGMTQIFTAKNGMLALDFMGFADGDDSVDVILCDWNMPRLSGLDLLKQIRTCGPDLPFLMITGNADLEAVVEAKTYGVTGYIRKPFSADQLRKKLASLSG